jgi:hypothetical protein
MGWADLFKVSLWALAIATGVTLAFLAGLWLALRL